MLNYQRVFFLCAGQIPVDDANLSFADHVPIFGTSHIFLLLVNSSLFRSQTLLWPFEFPIPVDVLTDCGQLIYPHFFWPWPFPGSSHMMTKAGDKAKPGYIQPNIPTVQSISTQYMTNSRQ